MIIDSSLLRNQPVKGSTDEFPGVLRGVFDDAGFGLYSRIVRV